VEHDLAVLDYMSDYVCCLCGSPSGYGVTTMPFSVRERIKVLTPRALQTSPDRPELRPGNCSRPPQTISICHGSQQ
jgi:hypothetical protein